MASHDYPACAIFRGGRCTCDEASQLEPSELDIEHQFSAPADSVQTSARPDPMATLQAEAAKCERRAITFGNILHNHILAMQAAIIEAEINGPAEGLQWIANTLFGPGHLPDVEAARALGGAQAWFDAEAKAEEERIANLKASGHLPDPPPAVWASARPYGHAGTHFVQWTDEKGRWFEQELDAFPSPAEVPPGAVRMDVALPIIGRQTAFDESTPTHPPVKETGQK